MKTARNISEKAYNDFLTRINDTLSLNCADQEACNQAISLLDNYITLPSEEYDIVGCCEKARIAFMMIRPEIDKAIIRSRAARERAKLRKKSTKTKSRKATKSKKSSELPDFAELLKLFGISEGLEGSDQADFSNNSDFSDFSDLAQKSGKYYKSEKSGKSESTEITEESEPAIKLSRRQRRAQEQDIARFNRRYARKLRREKRTV